MRFKDYTRLPLGTKFESGEIKICTYCSRHGLTEEVEGKTYFTHVEGVQFIQGNPEVRWDFCPQPQKITPA
jgi:hypothetical protein